ncbi:MAG: DUF4900 domain-containing protein [Ignavibacteriales bacterium]|nr:DUF4900 domain-containing protein [Ignavibacteriales bacterium]
MGGKGALLLVLGFSLIFMVAGRNFNSMATSTVENFASYYSDTKAHHLASSGVNLVTNQIFLNYALANGTFNYELDGGTITATLSTINVYQNIKQLTSTGTFGDVSTTIKIILKPSSFSKYAYFSNSEGANIWWTTGDTVWGPFHTNGQLRVADRPVFYGKVTIDGRLVKYSNSARPQFLGGFQTGVHVTIPSDGVTNLGTSAQSGGGYITGQQLVYMEFRGDSIRYRYNTSNPWTYVLASSFAPNGAIFAADAELRISGRIKGQYTIGASGTGGNRGKVYIDDDVYYNTDPQVDPNSQDMFGIVTARDVVLTDNAANNNNVKVQAAVYSETGSFVAENYQSRPVSGAIYLYGGVIQNARGPVGTFSTQGNTTTITSGFSKRYRYDDRFMLASPPFFPGTGKFEIVSWFE